MNLKPCSKGTTSIAETRIGAKLLKCYDQHEAAAQEESTSSTADVQASCEAPICVRDAAPRAPICVRHAAPRPQCRLPVLSVLPAGGYQATPQLHTRLVLPSTAWMHPSMLLLLLGGREYDFGGGWEEGSHKWRGFLYLLPLRLLQMTWLVLVDIFKENSGIWVQSFHSKWDYCERRKIPDACSPCKRANALACFFRLGNCSTCLSWAVQWRSSPLQWPSKAKTKKRK